MSNDQALLRQALATTADDVMTVELLERVLTEVDRRRRRRRLWVGAGVLAAAAATVAGVLVLAPSDRGAEPAEEPAPVRVQLEMDADDRVDSPLAVVDAGGGLYVVDAAGRQHRLGTDAPIKLLDTLSMSRDGRWISFGGTENGTKRVLVVDVLAAQGSTGAATVLEPEPWGGGLGGVLQTISPDGTWVAVVAEDVGGRPLSLQLLATDGSERRVVELTGGWDLQTDAGWVEWSADGSRILIHDVTGRGPASAAVLDLQDVLAGTSVSVTPVEFSGTFNGQANWAASPDLDQFALPSLREGEQVFTVFDTSTGEAVREIVRPIGDVLAGWHVDGSLLWLRYSVDRAERELFRDDAVVMVARAPAGQDVFATVVTQGISSPS